MLDPRGTGPVNTLLQWVCHGVDHSVVTLEALGVS